MGGGSTIRVWSVNTTPNRSTGYTPLFMVYGAEAVLPSDIRHDSPRVANYVEADNEQACQQALDLLDEKGTWLWLVRRFISKTRGVIIATGLKQEPFKKATWCTGSSRIRLICTSYPHLGKDPLWSARICTTGHTTSLMFESTKTHVNRRRRPSGRGI